MAILTVGATKGGVGKTTTALNIAVALALQERKVLAIDGDRQQTLMQSLSQREASPIIACSAFNDGVMLRQQVLHLQDDYDDIIIDAGGRDSTALRAALMLSDVLVIPFLPRSFDVWALDDVAALVAEANSMRDGLTVYLMLNQADPGGADNSEAVDAAEHFPFQLLDVSLGRRKAYANAAGLGLSVLETRDNEKAVWEMNKLIKLLFDPKAIQQQPQGAPVAHPH